MRNVLSEFKIKNKDKDKKADLFDVIGYHSPNVLLIKILIDLAISR